MDSTPTTRVLLIEDDPDNAVIIQSLLHRQPQRFQIQWADNLAAGLEQLASGGVEVVILDLHLPDSDGLNTFQRTHECAPQVAIVILTSEDDEENARQAIQDGAQDYLLKWEVNERLLLRSLSYAVERKRAEHALRDARDQLEVQVQRRTGELQTALHELQGALKQSRDAESRLQRQHHELATLHTMTAAISATLDLNEILSTLSHLLREQMGIPGGNLFLYEPERKELISQVSWGLPENLLAQCRRVPAARCHATVITGREAIFWEDLREVPQMRGLGLEQARPDWQSYLSLPLTALGEVRGVLDLFSLKPMTFNAEQMPFFLALGQQIGVAMHNAGSYEAEHQARKNSQKLSRQLVEVQEAERRRIARELHDELGQTLTGLKLTLESFGADVAERSRTSFQRAQQIVQELSKQMRELSNTLRPTMLDDLGLLPTLISHCQRYTLHTNVKVSLNHRHLEGRRFAPELETAAYRIIQEALTNVARHSQSRAATVHVLVTNEFLSVQIADRGRGFDPDRAGAATNGLRGMRERATLLGGKLRIDAAPNAGVSITASLPLNTGAPAVALNARAR